MNSEEEQNGTPLRIELTQILKHACQIADEIYIPHAVDFVRSVHVQGLTREETVTNDAALAAALVQVGAAGLFTTLMCRFPNETDEQMATLVNNWALRQLNNLLDDFSTEFIVRAPLAGNVPLQHRDWVTRVEMNRDVIRMMCCVGDTMVIGRRFEDRFLMDLRNRTEVSSMGLLATLQELMILLHKLGDGLKLLGSLCVENTPDPIILTEDDE